MKLNIIRALTSSGPREPSPVEDPAAKRLNHSRPGQRTQRTTRPPSVVAARPEPGPANSSQLRPSECREPILVPKSSQSDSLHLAQNINMRDSLGRTQLFRAAKAKDSDRVSLLLGQGADASLTDDENETALIVAVRSRNVKMVALLLSANAGANQANDFGQTALFFVNWGGSRDDAEILHRLLSANVDVNAKDKHGRIPLHLAARFGEVDMMRPMLLKGANVNAVADNGETPLTVTIQHGTPEMVELLLEFGADGHAVSRSGYTLVEMLKVSTVKGWLAAGDRLTSPNANGPSVLDYYRLREDRIFQALQRHDGLKTTFPSVIVTPVDQP